MEEPSSKDMVEFLCALIYPIISHHQNLIKVTMLTYSYPFCHTMVSWPTYISTLGTSLYRLLYVIVRVCNQVI